MRKLGNLLGTWAVCLLLEYRFTGIVLLAALFWRKLSLPVFWLHLLVAAWLLTGLVEAIFTVFFGRATAAAERRQASRENINPYSLRGDKK